MVGSRDGLNVLAEREFILYSENERTYPFYYTDQQMHNIYILYKKKNNNNNNNLYVVIN